MADTHETDHVQSEVVIEQEKTDIVNPNPVLDPLTHNTPIATPNPNP